MESNTYSGINNTIESNMEIKVYSDDDDRNKITNVDYVNNLSVFEEDTVIEE